MSKGARKRILYQESIAARQEKEEKEKKEQKRTRFVYTCVALVCVLIFVITIGGHLLVKTLTENGTFIRHKTIMKSDHYTIDGAMMTYYIHSELNDYVSQNSDDLESIGLDTEKSLKEQSCTIDEDTQTWFDYFSVKAQNKVHNMLVVAEAAYEAGVELSDEDLQEIQAEIDKIDQEANTQKMDKKEFMVKNYGQGVKEEDLINALKLNRISAKYKSQYKESLTFTDQEIKEFAEKNTKYFNVCDYYTITFVSSITDDMTEADIQAYNASSLKWAEGLAECHTVESFEDYLYAYFKKYFVERNQEYTDESIWEQIHSTATIVRDYRYADNELGNWALDSNREVGDTKIISGDNKYEVYMLVTKPHKDSYKTRNCRAIWFSLNHYNNSTTANTEARKVLAEWKKGDMTEDSFEKLATDYTDDTVAKEKGGLMDNCLKDEIDSTLSTWLYDTSRKKGDYSIINEEDSGNYVVYYLGEGNDSWKVIATEYAQDDSLDKQFAKWQDTYLTSTDALKLEELEA